MKILKVKVARNNDGGNTSYAYPLAYDASKIRVLAYESQSPAGRAAIVARGRVDEYIIGVVQNAAALLFTVDPDIVVITKAQAILLGDSWRVRIDKIQDESKVIRILAKKARGGMLTQQEDDALNPDHEESGVNKAQAFTDILSKQGA